MVLDMELLTPLPAGETSGENKEAHYFKEKSAAEQYILKNKPTTISTNNDDVACLSLNDLKNEWFGKDEERQYGGSWDGIPMYRRFKSIVKEKLK